MRRAIAIITALYLIAGCAGLKGPDYDILRRAEQAGARISSYGQAAAPNGEDVLIGTDVSDTSMSPAGTTKKYRLRDLPVSDPVQAALDALAAAKVSATLFDAHTVLRATTDNTPAALVLTEQTVLGRLTGGNIAALTLGVSPGNVLQAPADPGAHTLFGFDNTTNTYKPILIGSGLSFDQPSGTLSSTGSMVYPGAGIPNSTGSAWGTSYAVGTGANNLLQLSSDPGTPNGSKFLRDDLTWQAIPGGGDMLSTNNLSDVDNDTTALNNLFAGGYSWGAVALDFSAAAVTFGLAMSDMPLTGNWTPTDGTWNLSALNITLPGLKNGTISPGYVRLYDDSDLSSYYYDIIGPAGLAANGYIQTTVYGWGLVGAGSEAALKALVHLEPGTDVLAPSGSGTGLSGIPLDSDFSSNGLMMRTGAGTYGIAARSNYAAVAPLGSFASPITSMPYTLTAANAYAFVAYVGATGTVNLPAGAAGMNGIIYNTGAFTITIDPNGTEIVVRDGSAQSGGVSFTLSSGAGNFVAISWDGSGWVTKGYKGELSQGS